MCGPDMGRGAFELRVRRRLVLEWHRMRAVSREHKVGRRRCILGEHMSGMCHRNLFRCWTIIVYVLRPWQILPASNEHVYRLPGWYVFGHNGALHRRSVYTVSHGNILDNIRRNKR